jgi:hypothetical protein
MSTRACTILCTAIWSSQAACPAYLLSSLAGGGEERSERFATAPIRSSRFDRQLDKPRLLTPAYGTWKGTQVPLEASDISPGEGPIPERFSLERALALHLERMPGDRRPAGQPIRGRLGVLELRSYLPEMSPQNVRFLADLLRSEALKRASQYYDKG